MGALPGTADGKSASKPTPSTPGVWAVSHQELGKLRTDAEDSASVSGELDKIVTEVHFCWTEPAQSAFVTGDFNNWEITLPMHKVNTRDGEVWIASKALPPGTCQYKFIIDNTWRHAPDQPTAFDERGIINNCLTVTVDFCGEKTCFCSSFARERQIAPGLIASDGECRQVMTPGTQKTFQRSTGIAYTYRERRSEQEVQKSFMYKNVNHQPFDVVVVNVNNLKSSDKALPKDGLVSRASSFENLTRQPMRYDPTLPTFEDAAYEAALRADATDSMPHTASGYASIFASDPKELTYSVRARLSSPLLGFDPKECHTGIELYEKNHCAIRMDAKGLYKTVRGALPVAKGRKTYFEMYIAKQERGGGVCIGLSTCELPLSCLVGTRPNSIGFSTSGNIIQTVEGKEVWSKFGSSVDAGAVVGCLVDLVELPAISHREIKAELFFFVDGVELGKVDYVFMGDLEIFPTLSLFSRDGRVFSLFDASDMVVGETLSSDGCIYALDGTIINGVGGKCSPAQGLSSTART
eukprot:Plantae.Rhodophyta-Purpureofilum_apyrenoidigerum.ctg6948.p1 GENE.Plantae.Rhodophyta-Purpureofilum_apyrenoidigerum.ctg6948~~Plantae.Rhodophyta-Purpureofilum_apyrenoidigerum.ctg6948.p1  ORF type:complete len:523 (+),score=69.70 Plantae.Rhodophyta-Purpureofilum_apyrenoidigerum.ctg6948:290-1858(+)